MARGLVNIKVRGLFFDTPKVQRAVGKARRIALSRGGAILRREARQSMGRKKKKANPPGKAPAVHKGQLKRFLFFAYDPATKSVVVGPAQLGKSDVPRILEQGGDVVRTVRRRKRGGRSSRVKQRITIAARPYMLPSAQKKSDELPRAWKNTVRR